MSSPVATFIFSPTCTLAAVGSKGNLCSTPGSSIIGSPVMDDDAKIVSEFQLNFRLGEGAYGTVYSATHNRTKKPFAIKVVQRSDVKEVEKQIEKEAVIMQGLRHKHVVQFIKLLRTRDELFFVMELAEGGELFDLIIQSKHFSESVARKYFQQLISALAYCRKEGVVHRDLKAENLLLNRDGNLLVCDFGFSCKLLPVPSEDESDGRGVDEFSCLPRGTVHYLSPEATDLCYSNADACCGSLDPFEQDLWAAGVILFFMLSGQLPFDGRDEEETLFLIRKCTPDFSAIASPEARAFLEQLLMRDPMDRLRLQDILNDSWFLADMDFSLFPDEDESDDSIPPCEVAMTRAHSLRSQEGAFTRRPSSRMFLDFSHSPAETVSPTQEEEEVIRRAFNAIDTDGYGDHFTIDELRDALILLKKSTVDCEEVKRLLTFFTSTSTDSVTYKEFRSAWIHKDLAHSKHSDSQCFQLFKIANLTHTACEQNIVRQLRDAFNSVDELHTGVISFPQWKKIFAKADISVSDNELQGLLHYWTHTIPDGSGSISFEDFVAGIVKRDILLKHPLGKKLAYATNLGGFAELRSINQSVNTGFLVIGMRDCIAEKLVLLSERLVVQKRYERQVPCETVISFWFYRDGASDVPLGHSPPALRASTADASCTSVLRCKKSLHSPLGSSATTPPKGGGGGQGCSCQTCGCQLDVILCPTSCVGFTLVKLRRISGLTADFHECVQLVSSALERERDQAIMDSCVRGDSELM